ncbi:hypothetical protein HOY80DRAFT_1025848 [Tuber brumale]|nr:hypothetical protein HOY80DRAFT_1025848 [Tuber brumale]
MTRYAPLVLWSLLWLSTLICLSVSQSAWTLDPQKHLALMFHHMCLYSSFHLCSLFRSGLVTPIIHPVVNSTIYTIGGTAIYWTPESTAFSTVSDNNNSVHILKTSNSFLRALDLSKPVNLEAEFSDTSLVISELPFAIPLVKYGAVWADQNTIYYWGGELELESIYLNGTFQNRTREWPDPMKYYTYDLSQPRGSGTWKAVSISEAMGSDTLTSSPSYGESAYSTEERKGFYLGGVLARYEWKNKDGSNATAVAPNSSHQVSSMVVFDAGTNVWRNETIIAELNGVSEGAMVRFDTVHVYDIASRVWYRQPTTSKTKIFPENRLGEFCAGAVAAPDKTSFTIYIYGGFRGSSNIRGTWALTMPYFQWIPVGSAGEPEGGRSRTTCHTIGGQLAMVRGDSGQLNGGDTNGGTYFYDMTNLTWSLKYRPSEYRVPKTIYDVIGGNGLGGATLASPEDSKGFAGGLGGLFAAAANSTNSPNPAGGSSSPTGGPIPSPTSGTSPSSTGGASPSPTSEIVGGVIGGVALFAAIGAGIWMFLHLRHRRNLVVEARI